MERRSTVAIVADRIREAIMHGTLAQGMQLGEAELATHLGVSRGPLREAMQRLVAEGLLRSERHRGLFVRELDAAEVRDVHVTRAAVERAAGQLVIAGDRAAATLRLSVALAATEAAAGDPTALVEADHAFHTELVAASGSPRLRRIIDVLLVETRMCNTAPPEADALIAAHRALRDAVRDGDGPRLAALLEEQLAAAADRILAVPVGPA